VCIVISIGKWGGVWVYKGYGWRLCLGWIAFTFLPTDGDNILLLASKASDILYKNNPAAIVAALRELPADVLNEVVRELCASGEMEY